ncbi:DUF4240 domain-containing protein [Catenulispora pinisilvae]|uniref:DUF4240 domain-containing protein n=1 Tax=Catenulispora pinisilvae TaxID=2705253 RepID=UPI00189214F8|nr:DUF4240 domain-containing protein [Catenulispora pinisilvae]
MEISTWWGIVEQARAAVGDRADDRDPPDDPLPDALVDVLAALEPADIIDFYVKHVELTDSAERYPLMWAAFLIEGSFTDDGFMDFRDGLMLLGHETFKRAVADPDSLADLSVVLRMSRDEGGWIGYETLSYLIKDAYQRARGETDTFDTALEAAIKGMTRPELPSGGNWDPEDDDAMRHHLPRLAALFLD